MIQSFKDTESEIRKLRNELDLLRSKNIDLKQRRIVNAHSSIDPYDYVIRKELLRINDSINNITRIKYEAIFNFDGVLRDSIKKVSKIIKEACNILIAIPLNSVEKIHLAIVDGLIDTFVKRIKEVCDILLTPPVETDSYLVLNDGVLLEARCSARVAPTTNNVILTIYQSQVLTLDELITSLTWTEILATRLIIPIGSKGIHTSTLAANTCINKNSLLKAVAITTDIDCSGIEIVLQWW